MTLTYVGETRKPSWIYVRPSPDFLCVYCVQYVCLFSFFIFKNCKIWLWGFLLVCPQVSKIRKRLLLLLSTGTQGNTEKKQISDVCLRNCEVRPEDHRWTEYLQFRSLHVWKKWAYQLTDSLHYTARRFVNHTGPSFFGITPVWKFLCQCSPILSA